MEQIVLVVHLLVALAIIGLIMMQRGKGADIGASFGAGASQTLFGSSGSGNALTKMTAWLVVAFFSTSFGLAVIADNRTAGEEDLGFELPLEAAAAPVDPVEQIVADDLPVVEETVGPEMTSDVPVVEETPTVIDSNDDLPEG